MVETSKAAGGSEDAIRRLVLYPDGRIPLPAEVSRRIAWLAGAETAEGWLFLLSEGRYRLLSDGQVADDPHLESVRTLVRGEFPEEVGPSSSAPTAAMAAMAVRLIPVRLSRRGPAWRVSVPRIFRLFEPKDCDPSQFVIFPTGDGYWELWYADILRKAAFTPLHFD